MKKYLARLLAFGVFAVLLLRPAVATRADEATAVNGMVATVRPIATEAGVAAFRAGGNAVDAAVAAALTLGVVDGYNSGIGGGCFILIRLADGRFIAIDGRETAPALATRDMYLRNGKPQTEWSQRGPLASGTPGALAAYEMATRKFGRRSLASLLTPAAKIAQEGFILDAAYAGRIKAKAAELARFPGSRTMFLKADGSPRQAGEVLKLPDLASTYQSIAEEGVEWFYRGPFAARVGAWMEKNGGVLRADDFARYEPRIRRPVQTTYRDLTIVGFPPPSSGGVHVGQILNILEHFDLRKMHRRNPARYAHVVAEAMKLAFADRAYWLGDADFAPVPRGLISPQYAQELARRISLDRVTNAPHAGQPPRATEDLFGKHTTHIAAADREGNWVAITATINTTFGSKVVVPGTGVVLNNEMDDFSIQPGAPNAFGLVGAKANEVAPGKRPLSSMSPTIVLRAGRPVMTVGAAGGPKIITQVVLAVLNYFDLEMSLAESLAAARFHHQWRPDRLVLERTFDEETAEKLQAMGHHLQHAGSMGVSQAIAVSPDGERLIGVSDPRVGGLAAGY